MSTTNGQSVHANGGVRHQQEKVRVAIIGVGNCASAFVQGIHYYHDADPAQAVPGLMHVELGGYHVRDIEFTAAFDIDAEWRPRPRHAVALAAAFGACLALIAGSGPSPFLYFQF